MALQRTGWKRLKESTSAAQGCPLSPYLLLSSEILSKKIWQDPNIKGIKIYENEIEGARSRYFR